MKVDAYMPFYGSEFFTAVRRYGPEVGWPYLLAIWSYWSEHCVGLVNDEQVLRRICETFDDSQWVRARPIIFGHFFKLEPDGLWHQSRARKEHAKSVEISNKRSEIGKIGIAKRWQTYSKSHSKSHSKQDSKTDSKRIADAIQPESDCMG